MKKIKTKFAMESEKLNFLKTLGITTDEARHIQEVVADMAKKRKNKRSGKYDFQQ